jgi:predicted HicB family RNase H-like nuclease
MGGGRGMKYKDQYGTIEYWKDSNIWAGKLIGISDLVTYEADTYGDLWGEFVAAVDDYLETCKSIAEMPEVEE